MAYKPGSDRILFFTAGFLTIFGLLMVFSASSITAASQHGTEVYFFLRQLMYAGMGFIALLICMHIDYHFWLKPKVLGWMLFACFATLVLVFTQPEVNGAHRWLRLGPSISIQPSEFAKLILIVFTAWYLHKYDDEINRPARLLPFLAVIGFFAALIAIEPDLGQALCLALIVSIVVVVAGLSWKYAAAAFFMAIPSFYFLILQVPYRRARISAFLDPFNDPMGTSWQITQSLIAVGSGGVSGRGIGAGVQKLYFLPEANSDFIFAVIGEEIGLIGTSLVAIAFLVYFFRGMRIVLRSQDRFGLYLALGITLMVAIQGFINISMVLAIMPTKGIALPFISQGGSSLIMNLAATGILLNCSQRIRLTAAAG
ncbi:MAG TPA: putative lipid II flippase FtsW [Acidobacteriota bacterium]|nr:putative lipid II flippase FtsW [Acidobacteriota bacterium]